MWKEVPRTRKKEVLSVTLQSRHVSHSRQSVSPVIVRCKLFQRSSSLPVNNEIQAKNVHTDTKYK